MFQDNVTDFEGNFRRKLIYKSSKQIEVKTCSALPAVYFRKTRPAEEFREAFDGVASMATSRKLGQHGQKGNCRFAVQIRRFRDFREIRGQQGNFRCFRLVWTAGTFQNRATGQFVIIRTYKFLKYNDHTTYVF